MVSQLGHPATPASSAPLIWAEESLATQMLIAEARQPAPPPRLSSWPTKLLSHCPALSASHHPHTQLSHRSLPSHSDPWDGAQAILHGLSWTAESLLHLAAGGSLNTNLLSFPDILPSYLSQSPECSGPWWPVPSFHPWCFEVSDSLAFLSSLKRAKVLYSQQRLYLKYFPSLFPPWSSPALHSSASICVVLHEGFL